MSRAARSSCLHSVCWKLSSCFLGTLRAPVHWGCPSGGAPATATAASHTGTSAALQSLLSLFPPRPPLLGHQGEPSTSSPLCSITPLPRGPQRLHDLASDPSKRNSLERSQELSLRGGSTWHPCCLLHTLSRPKLLQ